MQLFSLNREQNRQNALTDIYVFDTVTSKGKIEKAGTQAELLGRLENRFGSGCAVAYQRVYVFGGGLNSTEAITRYSNDLLGLNAMIPEWFSIQVNEEKPASRSGLGMCSIGNQIFIFGGYGPCHDSFKKRGFVWRQQREGGSGWNNELAVFDLETQHKGISVSLLSVYSI